MTSGFAEGARRLSGLTTRMFGWTPDDFWKATPAELAAILITNDEQTGAPLAREELNSLMERDANG